MKGVVTADTTPPIPSHRQGDPVYDRVIHAHHQSRRNGKFTIIGNRREVVLSRLLK
jgi:hypothetical protein